MPDSSQLPQDQARFLSDNDALMRAATKASRIALTMMKACVIDYQGAAQSAAFAALVKVDPAAVVLSTQGKGVNLPASVYSDQVAAFQALIAAWDTPEIRGLHADIVGAANLDIQS
jgi:hypothetical protein